MSTIVIHVPSTDKVKEIVVKTAPVVDTQTETKRPLVPVFSSEYPYWRVDAKQS